MNLHIDNKVHIDDNDAAYKMYKHVLKLMDNLNYSPDRELVIMCIGTDRSTGDSLGPFVGKYLKEKNIPNVYGTIDNPVHGSNLDEYILKIKNKYNNPFIIAIDSALGKENNIGKISIKKGSLKPGTGVNKDLPEVGNMRITGTVNISGHMEYLVLQCTRLSLILKMSKIISYALTDVVNKLNTINNTFEKVAAGEGN